MRFCLPWYPGPGMAANVGRNIKSQTIRLKICVFSNDVHNSFLLGFHGWCYDVLRKAIMTYSKQHNEISIFRGSCEKPCKTSRQRTSRQVNWCSIQNLNQDYLQARVLTTTHAYSTPRFLTDDVQPSNRTTVHFEKKTGDSVSFSRECM